eukprot:9070520-Pyramimonas_sp.AAC.1
MVAHLEGVFATGVLHLSGVIVVCLVANGNSIRDPTSILQVAHAGITGSATTSQTKKEEGGGRKEEDTEEDVCDDAGEAEGG